MPWYDFFWTDTAIRKLAEHGLSPEDFEDVVCDPVRIGVTSSGSDRDAAWGYTSDGRYVICIFEMIDDVTVFPVTGYEVPE